MSFFLHMLVIYWFDSIKSYLYINRIRKEKIYTLILFSSLDVLFNIKEEEEEGV